MWSFGGASADSYYELKPECGDVPDTRFRIKAGKTLSQRRWHSSFSSEGYLDIGNVLGRIQRGGIHPSIRGEVWEFLLGCYDPLSTFEERDQLRQQRRTQYIAWKKQCHEMDHVVGSGRIITAPIITEDGEPIEDPLVLVESNLSGQHPSSSQTECSKQIAIPSLGSIVRRRKIEDKKIIQWKLTLHQIGLDVLRTDRTLLFYEKKENLSKLWDVLAVYAWIDKDVGYCQGMSDICSPMIILQDNEADSFWCFEHLMRRLRGNFRCTESSIGVSNQLQSLATVTQIIDPKLHQHLETLGGGDYLFAIRMLMVLFRREFSFGDSLYLWEMMWALEYDPEMFSMYKMPGTTNDNGRPKGKAKSLRQFGKFERENMKNKVQNPEGPLPISVFLVATVLKDKSSKLLSEAQGLDDVLKILNDVNGKLDAKKACAGAMKLHRKYLRKMKYSTS